MGNSVSAELCNVLSPQVLPTDAPQPGECGTQRTPMTLSSPTHLGDHREQLESR